MKDVVQKEDLCSETTVPVWRVSFRPGIGVTVGMLDQDGIEDVVGREDRVGFLPTWYWEELHASNVHIDQSAQGAEDHHVQVKASDAPPS
jgi:RAT1-interacting protein